MRVDGLDKGLSVDTRGAFGYGGGFGRIAFGHNRFGFYSKYSGIYQKHYRYGESYISKMKFYRPTNPQTETQQAWRSIFANGHIAWRALTNSEKDVYRLRAKYQRKTGFNIFMSEYLNENKN